LVAPRGGDRRSDPLSAGCDETPRDLLAVWHLEREPNRSRYASASLDRVDRGGLPLVAAMTSCPDGDARPPGALNQRVAKIAAAVKLTMPDRSMLPRWGGATERPCDRAVFEFLNLL
jgi:hypothetical protein